MLKKLLATLAVAAVCFGPATVLLSVAVLANPAVAACAPGSHMHTPSGVRAYRSSESQGKA